MGKHKSDDYKLQAIKHYLKNGNYVNTCRIFNCKRTSLMRWVEKYEEDNNVTNKNRPNLSYKVKQKHVDYALEIMKIDKLITLEQLNKKLEEKFKDYDITPRWLGKVIKDNFVTRKRTRKKHFPDTRFGKPINYKDEVMKFFNKINKYDLKNIISIDETSIKSGMVSEYCRNNIGKRCYYETKDNKVFRKYTLIVAISFSGKVWWKLYEKGGINADRYLEFIKENILTKYKNKLLLFDNAKAHTANIVLNEIKKNNDYQLVVAYSPRLNPIESYFSQLKHYIKIDKEIEYKNIKKSVENSIKKITKENYKNYFYNSLDKSKLPEYKPKTYINTHQYRT